MADDFALSEDLVQSPTHKAASTKDLDFNGLLQPGLQLHEDLSEGNGGQAWPAGMILARYLLKKKRDELREASMFVPLATMAVHREPFKADFVMQALNLAQEEA